MQIIISSSLNLIRARRIRSSIRVSVVLVVFWSSTAEHLSLHFTITIVGGSKCQPDIDFADSWPTSSFRVHNPPFSKLNRKDIISWVFVFMDWVDTCSSNVSISVLGLDFVGGNIVINYHLYVIYLLCEFWTKIVSTYHTVLYYSKLYKIVLLFTSLYLFLPLPTSFYLSLHLPTFLYLSISP